MYVYFHIFGEGRPCVKKLYLRSNQSSTFEWQTPTKPMCHFLHEVSQIFLLSNPYSCLQ